MRFDSDKFCKYFIMILHACKSTLWSHVNVILNTVEIVESESNDLIFQFIKKNYLIFPSIQNKM
jgi:hypothetical protein